MRFLSPFFKIHDKYKQGKHFSNIGPQKNSSFLHLNKNGVIKKVSDEFVCLIGYNKAELKGKNISSFIYKSKKNIVTTLISELSSHVPFKQCKISIEDSRGNVINTELYLTLTSLEDRAPIFAIFRKSGIHQEKYNSLFEKKERLRVLAENSREVQVLFDSDMKALYVSPSCYELTGYEYSELIESDLHNYVHYDDLDKFWDSIKQATHVGKSFLVLRVRTTKGSYIYVEGHIQAITDEFNGIKHYALYIHDARGRIKYEQQLLKSKNESEKANKLKDHFLASVSHEFRTPLNAIIGFSRIMGKVVQDPEHNIYIKNIEISGVQLLDMVNNLLSFSKVDNRELETSIEPIHIKSFFKELDRRVESKYSKYVNSEIKISSGIETLACGEYIYSDKSILVIIFENLINNAVKFTNKGFVKYGIKPYGLKNYVFYVEDSGVGISKEYQNKIFDSLSQQDTSLTREYGGIGLGLSVTKRMVELLDGEIWAKSEEGEGSIFCFKIPSRVVK